MHRSLLRIRCLLAIEVTNSISIFAIYQFYKRKIIWFGKYCCIIHVSQIYMGFQNKLLIIVKSKNFGETEKMYSRMITCEIE